MTSPPRSIRISDVGDLVETIPFLIGFHPEESVVVIGFSGARPEPQRVTVTMRVDLPVDPGEPEVMLPLLRALARSRTESVVLAVVSRALRDDPRADPIWPALFTAVSGACAELGIGVADLLLMNTDRWWSLLCDDESCCPPEGTVRERDSSSAAAQATYAGLVAWRDRASLEQSLVGDDAAHRSVIEPQLLAAAERIATAAARNQLARLRRTDTNAILTAAAAEPTRLTPRRLARFGCALADLSIRDAIWLRIDDRSVDAAVLLDQLHRRLPAPFDAPPMFLYGWHEWRAGNGTVAAMAADRALASDPGYSAATLLLEAVQSGMDPHRTPLLTGAPLTGAPFTDASDGDGDEDVLGDLVQG